MVGVRGSACTSYCCTHATQGDTRYTLLNRVTLLLRETDRNRGVKPHMHGAEGDREGVKPHAAVFQAHLRR